MNQDDKNVMFKKSTNVDHIYNQEVQTEKNNDLREKSILKLMDQFGLSYDEAEVVLVRIENMENQNKAESPDDIKQNNENVARTEPALFDDGSQDVIIPQHVIDRENEASEQNIYSINEKPSDVEDSVQEVVEEDNESTDEPQDNEDAKKEMDNQVNDESDKPEQVNVKRRDSRNALKQPENQDIDSILSDMVPDFDQQISIEVNNVNLTFDVVIDKIDTLKESFIRTIKRNKSKKTKFKVLSDINFTIYKGEKVGIIGYNGAGKSTLLKVITGIYPPDTGSVKTYGNISPLLSLGAGFDRNYSGRKNIYLNGAVLGYDKQFLKDKEEEIIEFSELGEFIDYPIKNYSSGMLAKLGFSIATLVDPDILIIDEILGVGDVNFRRKSSDKINSLMDGRTTVLLVSHSIPRIRSLCDRAIWIDKGRVREIGDVNDVCDNYLKDSEKASKEQLKNIKFR